MAIKYVDHDRVELVPVFDLLSCRTEHEALRQVTTQVAHEVELGLSLDSFGHDVLAEDSRQVDDGGGDREVLAGAINPAHQTLVNFHELDVETPEMFERGEAGSEIVNANSNAVRDQRCQRGD